MPVTPKVYNTPKEFRKKKTIGPKTIERNKATKAAALLKKRREYVKVAQAAKKEQRIRDNLALPLTTEEITTTLTKRMASVPDDNPVKQVCQAQNHDPLLALVKQAKYRKTDPKVRRELNMFLANKLVPNPKSVDQSVKSKMKVTVRVQSYKDATQAKLNPKFQDSDYTEFEENEDE